MRGGGVEGMGRWVGAEGRERDKEREREKRERERGRRKERKGVECLI